MRTHANKVLENESQLSVVQKNHSSKPAIQFTDNRPETSSQSELQETANRSPLLKQTTQLQAQVKDYSPLQPIIQKKKNNTGLPDRLKAGVERLSGYSMDNVRVHYNSPKPAQLQAHAYAQGTNIHLASGQEKHLPHEAWHVVQQMQGRVKPTRQMKGSVNVNDDATLENEADLLGARAEQIGDRALGTESKDLTDTADTDSTQLSANSSTVQRKVGYEFQTGWTAKINNKGIAKDQPIGSLNSDHKMYDVKSDNADGDIEFIIYPPVEIDKSLLGKLNSIFDGITKTADGLIRTAEAKAEELKEAASDSSDGGGEEILSPLLDEIDQIADLTEFKIKYPGGYGEIIKDVRKGKTWELTIASAEKEDFKISSTDAGGLNLNKVFIVVEDDDDESYFDIRDATFPLSHYTKNEDDSGIVITPLEGMQANPQTTGGFTMEQLKNLIIPSEGNLKAPEHFAQTLAGTAGLLNLGYLNSLKVSEAAKGFIMMLAHYIAAPTRMGAPVMFPKNITDTFAMARTDFATLLKLVPKEEAVRWKENPKGFIETVLKTAKVEGPNKDVFDKGILMDPNGQEASEFGPTREKWISGILEGKDLITAQSHPKFEAMGLLGDKTETVGQPKNAEQDSAAGGIFEIRAGQDKPIDYTKWIDYAKSVAVYLLETQFVEKPKGKDK